MAGLYLHSSNRLEILADSLAELISQPLASPFDKEIIVVQSRGMERWLRMQLALRHGISANLDFPFPNTLFKAIYYRLLGEQPLEDAYEVNTLVWRIMEMLPKCLDDPEFVDVKHYLERSSSDEGLYQLSKYITMCFDQYLVFRPDMIMRWEKGQGRHWQAVLWRRLTRASRPMHKARAKEVLLRALNSSRVNASLLPKRISVFGISSLPPYHLDLLNGISRLIDVHFFVMNPCKEYWFDIVSERRLRLVIRQRAGDLELPDKLHLETGNALLASMGHLGRDFLSGLIDLDPIEEQRFVEPGFETMLTAVQSDILGLKESSSHGAGPISVRRGDTSISIHSCHSPLREMEVLYDNLLRIFDEEPNIAPKDVVVMAPDIRQYTPFIDAIFGRQASDSKALPYTIADRGYMSRGEIVPALFHLFELIQSRFTVSSVLSFLEREPVKRRFGLSDNDIGTIRRWVADTRVHWGIDENMKQGLGLPRTRQNTWQAALERLLLGYALPAQGRRLFKGILPYDHVEGESPLLLGNLASFLLKLAQNIDAFSSPATIVVWYDRLKNVIEGFFRCGPGSEHELETLLDILADLRSGALKAGAKTEISYKVVKAYLEARIEEAGLAGGFLSKGITFCSILPMRSIPFKVVCLLGMNHDAYPRDSRELAFDLMAARPRKGDRSRRKDDRYLFLEAILSARQHLIISYVGQNETNNSTIPPSPLVSELLDYLERNFFYEDGSIGDKVLTIHRLRPFNFIYFEPGSGLFTYSEEHLEAAKSYAVPREGLRKLFREPLPVFSEEVRDIAIEDLERFLSNPARFILQKRLKVRFRTEDPLPPDQEPAVLKGLEAYNLDQRILKARLSGISTEGLYPLVRAEGLLPHASVGAVEYQRRSTETEEFSRFIGELTGGAKPEWVEVSVQVNGHKIHGRVGEIYKGKLIHYRYAKLRARDYLRLWLYHLLFSLMTEGSEPTNSYLCGKDGQWRFGPVGKPQKHLTELIATYIEGLSKPIKFFPESSFTYAIKLLVEQKSELEALQSADKAWQGSRYNRGEKEDDYLRVCFREQNPMDSEFKEMSVKVFHPLLAHREQI